MKYQKHKCKNIKIFKFLILIFYFWFLIFYFTGCSLNQEIYKSGEVIINNQIIKVKIAQRPRLIQKGLSGQDGLAENQGMLFVFSKPDIYEFWMKDMKFPLDIIWINNGQIVEIWQNAPLPQGKEIPHYRPKNPANYVLEVKAGTAKKYGWQVDDKIELRIKNF